MKKITYSIFVVILIAIAISIPHLFANKEDAFTPEVYTVDTEKVSVIEGDLLSVPNPIDPHIVYYLRLQNVFAPDEFSDQGEEATAFLKQLVQEAGDKFSFVTTFVTPDNACIVARPAGDWTINDAMRNYIQDLFPPVTYEDVALGDQYTVLGGDEISQVNSHSPTGKMLLRLSDVFAPDPSSTAGVACVKYLESLLAKHASDEIWISPLFALPDRIVIQLTIAPYEQPQIDVNALMRDFILQQ